MKKIIAIILCLMVLMLSACGELSDETTPSTKPTETTAPTAAETLPEPTDQEQNDTFRPDEASIVGTWETDFDFAGVLNILMRSEPEMGEYFKFSEIVIGMVYQFEEDGTYTLSVDTASAEKCYDDVIEQMIAGLRAYFTDNNVDFDAMLDEAGTAEEALAEAMMSKESFLANLSDLEGSGTYTLDGETLTIDDDVYSCQFASENELTLDTAEDLGGLDFMFPMTLRRK